MPVHSIADVRWRPGIIQWSGHSELNGQDHAFLGKSLGSKYCDLAVLEKVLIVSCNLLLQAMHRFCTSFQEASRYVDLSDVSQKVVLQTTMVRPDCVFGASTDRQGHKGTTLACCCWSFSS